MKIFIDINHPAHVHYFKNFIKIMEERGHVFVVTNRDSKIINQLLDAYGIKHFIRNKRPTKKSLVSTILYLLGIIGFCVRKSLKERPDIYLGFGSSPAAITAFLFGKPSVLIDDTEHNKVNHALYKPFCSAVLTPFYFKKDLGDKQLYFHAYVEQLYLSHNYYKPDTKVLEEIGLNNSRYALVRYISYDARHDSEVNPIPEKQKREFITELSKEMRVMVSLEGEKIDEFYKPYVFSISPEKMHDIMANADFLLTEGATMASEAFILGTPYLYINPLMVGYITEQTKSYPKFAAYTTDDQEVFKAVANCSQNKITPIQKAEMRDSVVQSTIDPTALLVWFVENFPESKDIMKNDPQYQFKFKNK